MLWNESSRKTTVPQSFNGLLQTFAGHAGPLGIRLPGYPHLFNQLQRTCPECESGFKEFAAHKLYCRGVYGI